MCNSLLTFTENSLVKNFDTKVKWKSGRVFNIFNTEIGTFFGYAIAYHGTHGFEENHHYNHSSGCQNISNINMHFLMLQVSYNGVKRWNIFPNVNLVMGS